jgi:eukaryotic-like serine/threonine-protein kinase
MGQVYCVEQATLGRAYALKVLHADVVQRDPNSVERFVREARAASRIRHPNIVDVFDFGYLADGRPYFVMELLDGHSLGDRIDRDGALDVAEALALAGQLVVALAAAHDVGVVHADVTPGNIFVVGDATPHVKLVDFGLAELHDNQQLEVASGFVMGTPHYVSPEQLTGRRATEHSDQYAVGCVLFEMLAGQPPFRHPDLPALCRQHIFEDAPAVASPLGLLPTGVKQIVARCLAKSPADRFTGMAELAEHLDAAAQLLALGVI